jgi:hypothetical protein
VTLQYCVRIFQIYWVFAQHPHRPNQAATKDARNLIGDELHDSSIRTLEKAVQAGKK